jgi:hypothetical protein
MPPKKSTAPTSVLVPIDQN